MTDTDDATWRVTDPVNLPAYGLDRLVRELRRRIETRGYGTAAYLSIVDELEERIT